MSSTENWKQAIEDAHIVIVPSSNLKDFRGQKHEIRRFMDPQDYLMRLIQEDKEVWLLEDLELAAKTI